MLMKEA